MAAPLERIEAVFHAVRVLPHRERSDALDRLCDGDRDLRHEVESLLAALDAGPHVEMEPHADVSPDGSAATSAPPPIPGQLGRYRILGTLGEGGMALVHLAEQDAPRRTVALKVLRAGRWNSRLLDRFELEAEMLGRLHHPNIAHVHEAAVARTEAGIVPFIAMERVRGVTLDRWVRDEKPNRATRLDVFLLVCDAIQHAHQRGVIHRDLKPQNIVVGSRDGTPWPKVIDFGIARDLTERGNTGSHTVAGELLGTPETMSPEQAAGAIDAVDVRTDVYALGAVLYELLSGQPPFGVADRTLEEALRAVREQDPPRLGTLDRSLAGDLETITAHAMEKRREDRYQGVAELAADIRRHRANEPITACSPTLGHRLVKFSRRHRGPIAAAAALLLTLAGGLVATANQAIVARSAEAREREARTRAEARFDDLRRLARVFIQDFDSLLERVPGTLAARRLLVETGLEYLDRLALEADDEPELQIELAMGYLRLGDIQGGRWRPNLGDSGGALSSYRRAADLVHGPWNDPDQERRAAMHRVEALVKQGDMHEQLAEVDAAAIAYGAAQEALTDRLDADPSNPELRGQLSAVLAKRAVIERVHGDARRAVELLAQSDALLPEPGREGTTDPRSARARAANAFQLALALEATGERESALSVLTSFVSACEALLEASPHDAQLVRDLVVGLDHHGRLLLDLGRSEDAEQQWVQAIARAEAAAALAPDDTDALALLATLSCRLGERRLAENRLDEAAAQFARGLDAATQRADRSPDVAMAQRELGVAQYKMGELARARAQALTQTDGAGRQHLEDARSWFTRCRATFEALESDGRLQKSDAGALADIAEQIADCEAVLGGTPASGG
ncbi:MAG: serine/threonine protein kinase [Phycisphaerales bacterium]|nr:serine/threonine protein kinase [Phycisphaerales bacterium]